MPTYLDMHTMPGVTTSHVPGVPNDAAELGGEEAEVRSFVCAGYTWLQITALHGGNGYVVWLVATAPPDPEQRPINDQLLGTFRFTD
ncbi:MAG TPA: hypothetical protein VF365_02400 [Candidatus Limnocylindria bacterium]